MELTAIERDMIDAINQIRAEHHACTAGAVAALRRMKKPTVINRMERMRIKGLVTWTPMAGSLRVVGPHAPDAAEPASQPVDRTGIGGNAVAEAAGTGTAPVAARTELDGQTNIIDHLTDELGAGEGVSGDDGPTIHVGPPVRNEAKVAKKAATKKAAPVKKAGARPAGR